jgi:hypothetical protein
MNSSNLSVASKPAINFGVLFILGFALIVGTRPVRADGRGSKESVTRSEIVSLADANISNDALQHISAQKFASSQKQSPAG